MQITRWQEFSHQAITNGVVEYTVYYERESPYIEQNSILLNNITRALGWRDSEILFKVISRDFNVSAIKDFGTILWFGLQAAVKLGLIQQPVIQQVNNIVFCPSANSISRDARLKRQAWEALKVLKL